MDEQVKDITNSHQRGPRLLWIPLCRGNHLALYDNELAEGLNPEMFQRGIRRAKGIKRKRESTKRWKASGSHERSRYANEKGD